MTYRTLAESSQGIYKEKGSKFLAFAYPVTTTDGVKELLLNLQKLHHQARHHCYAYVLGVDGQLYRSNDAGEPRHSAGDPILRQIRAHNLTNVLVVVVRYFGGSKLGIGGLTQAYKEASKSAIENGRIVEKEPRETWKLAFNYPEMNSVMGVIKELNLNILNQELTTLCIIILEVPHSAKDLFQERCSRLKNIRLQPQANS